MFLQRSDLFSQISGFERSDFIGRGGTDEEDNAKVEKLEAEIEATEIDAALAFSLKSQPGELKKMKGDLDWHKKRQLQRTLAAVHRRTFELLVTANSLATSSTEVRCRVVDKEFFKLPGVQRDRRRGYQNMWIGSLREGATLCTSPSFNGAFEATRKYDKPDELDKGATGLVNVCGAETYRFSQFSPFPQEEEWVVPPGSEDHVLVAERGTENILAFFTRIEGAIHVDRTLRDARRICLKGVQVLKRQHREATGYAVERFAATTHYVLLVPKTVALGS